MKKEKTNIHQHKYSKCIAQGVRPQQPQGPLFSQVQGFKKGATVIKPESTHLPCLLTHKSPDIGNERWISHQTSAAIDQYKKDDEARAAEVWVMDQAKEFVRSQPVVPLSEEKQQQMFGIVQTPQAFNNQFINKVGLSRQKLREAGLSLETIERVYRALFVYSHGFHEMLSEVSNNCRERRRKIVTKLWEIFNALLERCEERIQNGHCSGQSDYTQQRETVIQSYERRMNDMGVIQSKILSDLNVKTHGGSNSVKTSLGNKNKFDYARLKLTN